MRHSCSTAINAAWQGTDKNSYTFTTGSQLQRVNTLSLVSLFTKAYDKFSYAVSTQCWARHGQWGVPYKGAQ